MSKASRILAGFVLLHVLVWTLLPSLVRVTLPMDAMEGATWGHQLLLGYDKNPFLNAWLTSLALAVGGTSGWMVYLFSQLSVAACFLAVYQLGRQILSPLYALTGVLMLEGLQYYNFHAIDFNDNTLELSLWSLLILFFWKALTFRRLRDWCLAGCFAGLAMMAKYYAVVLLLPLFAYMLYEPEARKQFREKGVYCAAGIFLLVIAPHVVWLFGHDFVTIEYAFQRTDAIRRFSSHLFYPAQFFWQQCEVLLPGLFLLLPFMTGKPVPALEKTPTIKRIDATFLLFAGLGPLIVTMLLSGLFGMKLRAGWGQPLLSLSGLLLMLVFRPVMTRQRLRRFLILLGMVFCLMAGGYCIALLRGSSPSSANFPGSKISAVVTHEWHVRYRQPLKYVVGPRWYAGNIAFYAKEKPAVYMEANPKFSPWINEAGLQADGALFVWEQGNPTFETMVRKRFPSLGPTLTFVFPWARSGDLLPPIILSVAFLSPSV